MLDEPTNDLDMETLDLLQELVAGFAGTVILVSHDRDFLDRTVTSVLAPEGDGRWSEYAGGYSDMLAQRGTSRFERPPGKTGRARRPRRRVQSRDRAEGGSEEALLQAEIRAGAPARAHAEGRRPRSPNWRTQMADPALYARDPDGFSKTATALDEARRELSAMEEEWLELEMLREEVEGG